jgi:hypothetical protein
MDKLMNFIVHRVCTKMNVELDKPFTQDEVRAVLFHMAPSKAPGVGGFTIGFF